MKNTIIVVIGLLLSSPVLAQKNAAKMTGPADDAVVVYSGVNSYLQGEKNNHGLLLQTNNKQWNYNRFIELFNHLLHPAKKSTGQPVTFMNGPVVYSTALPVEISRNANTLYQRYSESIEQASATTVALQILGLAAGITAGAFNPKYTGGPDHYPYYMSGDNRIRYLDNRAAIEGAYLQSTYHQHDR